MRQIFVLSLVFLLIISAVSAANVGTVVLLANGTVHSECVNIADGGSAYDAFQEVDLSMTWTGSAFGYFLEEVEGVASDADAGKYWSLWHHNSAGTDFESSMVGASDYEINNDGHVMGVSYTAFDDSFMPITSPPFSSYNLLCPNELDVRAIKIYVDEDKTSANENGDDFEVKPGSTIRMEVRLENDFADIDINDISVEAIIYEIDDGDDLDDDVEINLNDGEDDTVELNFEVPIDIDEDTFDMVLTIEGTDDNGLVWRYTYNFDVEVDKEKHELVLEYPENLNLVCGQDTSFTVKTVNLGAEDEEDVVLRASNADLGLDFSETFDVDENEKEGQTIRLYDVKEGHYLIDLALEYEEETLAESVDLVVECGEQTASQTDGVQQQTGMIVETVDFVTEPEPTTTTTNLNFDEGKVLLVLLNLVLVAVLVFLVIVLKK